MADQEEKCIFCNVIKENNPTTVVYVDDQVVVIKDKFPAATNHLLVLPRRHIINAKHLKKEDYQLGFNLY
jgi:histidine triad (HIT) family protein